MHCHGYSNSTFCLQLLYFQEESFTAHGYKVIWQPKCVRSHLSRQVNGAFQTWVIKSTSAFSVIQRCSLNCQGWVYPECRAMFLWTEVWEKAKLISKMLHLMLKFILSLNLFHFPSETSFCHSWFHTLNVNMKRILVLHCLKNQCTVWLLAGVFNGKDKYTL